jgi:hypothetical protein
MIKFPRSEPELVTHVRSVTHASEREPRATQVYSALAYAAVISAGSAGPPPLDTSQVSSKKHRD